MSYEHLHRFVFSLDSFHGSGDGRVEELDAALTDIFMEGYRASKIWVDPYGYHAACQAILSSGGESKFSLAHFQDIEKQNELIAGPIICGYRPTPPVESIVDPIPILLGPDVAEYSFVIEAQQ